MSKNPKSIMAKNSSWTFKGNIAKTSSFVGMDRSALHRKIKELEISIKN